MTREEQRQLVICSCIEQQEHIADIARQEMDSAQQQAADYGANVDRYDAYRTKMMRSRDMYARQLSGALAGIRALKELQKMPPFDTAEHGAVVITTTQNFLLSIGAGKFMVGNRPFFAISAQTPIYAALRSKRVGDTIVFNGLSQTVKEIY